MPRAKKPAQPVFLIIAVCLRQMALRAQLLLADCGPRVTYCRECIYLCER